MKYQCLNSVTSFHYFIPILVLFLSHWVKLTYCETSPISITSGINLFHGVEAVNTILAGSRLEKARSRPPSQAVCLTAVLIFILFLFFFPPPLLCAPLPLFSQPSPSFLNCPYQNWVVLLTSTVTGRRLPASNRCPACAREPGVSSYRSGLNPPNTSQAHSSQAALWKMGTRRSQQGT